MSTRVRRSGATASSAASPAWSCHLLNHSLLAKESGAAYASVTFKLSDLYEKSSKTFCCPVSPSARRTASWKSLNEYRTIAGGVSAPFDNIVRRSLVAARTSANGCELTQRGSHHPRTVVVE